MDQNNIILILLLIAVLVAFYAIYLAMENSKRIKKVSVEMMDLAKLVQESSNLRDIIPESPINQDQGNRPNLDEYPSMEEINSTLQAQEKPLDDSLKRQIDSLEEMDEEQLLNLERQLEDREPELVPLDMSGGQPVENNLVQKNAEQNEGDSNGEIEDGNGEEHEDGDGEEHEDGDGEEHEDGDGEEHVDGDGEEHVDEEEDEESQKDLEENGESSSNEFPSLQELTENGLNELNCEDLRDICKREELRTRGRKAELVERILKKKEALA